MTSHVEGARDRDALQEGPLPPVLGVSTTGGGGRCQAGVVTGRGYGLGAQGMNKPSTNHTTQKQDQIQVYALPF